MRRVARVENITNAHYIWVGEMEVRGNLGERPRPR
jgi:hypothetical protein